MIETFYNVDVSYHWNKAFWKNVLGSLVKRFIPGLKRHGDEENRERE